MNKTRAKYVRWYPDERYPQWQVYKDQNLENNTNPVLNGDNKKPVKDMTKFWAEVNKDLMT